MLEKYIKKFKGEKSVFNVNMNGNVRTLHVNTDIIGPTKKKVHTEDGMCLPYKKCPYQEYDKFIPFPTLKKVEAFEKEHACSFKRCGNCFPPSKRGN